MKKKMKAKKPDLFWATWDMDEYIQEFNDFKKKYGYYPNEKVTKESKEYYNRWPELDDTKWKKPKPISLDKQIKELKENIIFCKQDIRESEKELKKLELKKRIKTK